MGAYVITGAAVSVYAEAKEGLAEQLDRAVLDTAFRLDTVEPGPVAGTVTCRFALHHPSLAVGSGNLVDLQYRLQREFELHGAERLSETAAVGA